MNTTDNAAPERQEIEELLPWHAAGTLSEPEARRVEAALAQDAELARRFALAREELAETIHLNETLGAPSARAMERLLAGIEAESGPAPAAPRRFSLLGFVGERFAALSPRALAYSAIGAALAIALQAGLLAALYVGERAGPGAYQTASRPAATAPLPGSFVILGFNPEASAAAVTAFLAANKLAVVDGPRAGGLYRVRVAATALPKEQVADIAEKLKAQAAIVRFVAPTE
jgi:hypothetical protein